MTPEPIAVSIVVPVYNAEASIERLTATIEELPIPGGHELILVNDGSRDHSAEICRALAARKRIPITFIDLMRNFGEHNAVMAGLRHARGEYVVTLDDDFQNPPAEVVRLVAHTREHALDAVYTVFTQKRHARWRNWGSRLTVRVSDLLLDKPRGLYLSSFRCLHARVVRAICVYEGAFPYVDGMVLQVTQRIGQLEVEHAERQAGQSGYTLRRLTRLWMNMFVNFSIMPLRIATVLGLATAAAGFLGIPYLIIDHMQGHNPPGWATLMCSLLVFSGTQLTILGLLGEYLGRLFLNANRKPQYIIRDLLRPAGDAAPGGAGDVA